MFPKTGNTFPSLVRRISAHELAEAISAALREELGSSHVAAKTVMRWTGASERTVKHWLAGTHTPSGWHLIMLARESDAALATVLVLAGRELNVSALSLVSLRAGLMTAVKAIDTAIESSE